MRYLILLALPFPALAGDAVIEAAEARASG
jgi:hypothetical protein